MSHRDTKKAIIRKVVIGLTGGVASGKSTVLKEFKKYKFIKTIDVDRFCHKLYGDEKIRRKILEEFKTLNRKKIAEIVFSDKTKRLALEAIIHPPVIRWLKEKIDKYKAESGVKAIVAEIPLLFEKKLERIVDKVVLAYAPVKVQVKRAINKYGITREQALMRIKSQLPWKHKIFGSDYIINTTSGINEIRRKIKKIIFDIIPSR